MKHTTTVNNLDGMNESPVGGDFIVSSNRDFVTRRVIAGISVLTNESNGKCGIVTMATATRVDAVGINFKPGDFFSVTLASPWTVQTVDGPVIEVECNRCGFSYPSKELTLGLCKICIDKSKPI